MKVICAPDSFKESISAIDAAEAMARGVRQADPAHEVMACPVGDGGEGTLDVVIRARGGEMHTVTVSGPRGQPVSARYGLLGDGAAAAVVELAEASGLSLLPRELRDPTCTSTHGTGEVIRHAIARNGVRSILLFIGGSATVDGGAGMAQVLGARFFDANGSEIRDHITGGTLSHISRVAAPATDLPTIRIAVDVMNPLCGPSGAAQVYGPQKGATPEQVAKLDAGLAHLAELLGAEPRTPGYGAAGGAPVCLVMLCSAQMERGIELVLETLQFKEHVHGADLVLTGEGTLDAQSLHGKATLGVAEAAARMNVPTIAIVGAAGAGAEQCVGEGRLKRYVSMADRFGVERSLAEPAQCLSILAAEIMESA